jgi:O-antigen ligase
MAVCVCVYYAFRNDAKMVFAILTYFIYLEIFMRAYVTIIPYLFVQYLFIAVFGVLILKKGNRLKMHSRTFVFLMLFMLIELINSKRSIAPDIARALVMNDLALVVMVMWGCCNFISPALANYILKHVKYAGVCLCGIILARYVFTGSFGAVHFSSYSASEATNGLAPVQLSGYLGFSSSIFFFSIMNDQERKDLFVNIGCFGVSTVLMLLSFSRGGLYFLGIMMILYFFFNRDKAKSYSLLLLLIPIGIFIYNYVITTTGGLIADRYEQGGTSGRDRLITAGWELFKTNPLAGIGTGNFNDAVLSTGLYEVESGAHNEFIRVLAEDGVLGIVTYGFFYVLLFYEIFRRKGVQREFAIYFLIFFCLINVHNGLKLSLQPLILTLAVGTPNILRAKKKKNVSINTEHTVGFGEN